MKLIILCVALFGAVYAGRLDHLAPSRQYIPSQAPNQYPSPNNQYLAPAAQNAFPNNQYQAAPAPISISRKQYNAPASFSATNRQYLAPASHGASGSSEQYSQRSYNQVQIVRLDNNPNAGDGTYSYAYETADGISAQEQGNHAGNNGGFAYTSPNGEQVSLQYTADENGFHPQGSHLPTPPPVPEAIQRSIEQNLAEEARGGYREGQYNQQYSAGSGDIQNGGYKY